MKWKTVTPNEHGDWISHRNNVFETYIPLGDKDIKETIFIPGIYCRGLESPRDAWVYNLNATLIENISKTIDFFNSKSKIFAHALKNNPALISKDNVSFVNSKISWSRSFLTDIQRGTLKSFNLNKITIGIYRPFFKQNLYFSRELNNFVSRLNSFFQTIR